jgi:hypothetical protein
MPSARSGFALPANTEIEGASNSLLSADIDLSLTNRSGRKDSNLRS